MGPKKGLQIQRDGGTNGNQSSAAPRSHAANPLFSQLSYDLPNPFKNPAVTIGDEDFLRRAYQEFLNSSHRQSLNIQTMLLQTFDFFLATTLEADSKKIRDQNRTKADSLKLLNTLGTTITKVEDACRNETDKNAQAIFSLAIEHCIASISMRLGELKKCNDNIYKTYESENNSLKNALQKHAPIHQP